MTTPHLSLSLSPELWQELLASALPVRFGSGELDMLDNARAVLRRLGVRKTVAGLLDDPRTPGAFRQATEQAKTLWRARRAKLLQRLGELVRVEGVWRFELDELGTQLRYQRQSVVADAYLKGIAEGTLYLLNENMAIPFVIERRVGATVSVKDIHYDPNFQSVIGSLGDLGLHIGNNAALQLLARLAEYLIDTRLAEVGPLSILKRDHVQNMVGAMGSSMRMNAQVSDLDLQISENDMVLNVRFGFSQLQLTNDAG